MAGDLGDVRAQERRRLAPGFLDPEQQYAAVEQSTDTSAKYLARVTQQAAATGQTQQVGDTAWERWDGEKYDALVRQEQGHVTVVTGTASFEQLAKLAASLEFKQGK